MSFAYWCTYLGYVSMFCLKVRPIIFKAVNEIPMNMTKINDVSSRHGKRFCVNFQVCWLSTPKNSNMFTLSGESLFLSSEISSPAEEKSCSHGTDIAAKDPSCEAEGNYSVGFFVWSLGSNVGV
ncbi:hypothetical protein OUZ56_029514 [Daphnia magna]|uniref:Uncharacterized protein n=1 Tax=Daphnia magna TaxID=35525 RepID=A0ABR0B721_9CRUS|nr:hypothetical protein OUZ56_029514 [Daphnia magna]